MNINKLNLSAIPKLPLEGKSYLPPVTAIYFVMDASNRVLYVGKATNLKKRWFNHHRFYQFKEIANISIAWVEVSKKMIDLVEKEAINKFSPILNFARKNKGFQVNITLSLKACEELRLVAQWKQISMTGFVSQILEREHESLHFSSLHRRALESECKSSE